jgi:hypothetical protein
MVHFQLNYCGANIPVFAGLEAIIQDPFDLRPATPGGSISGTEIGNDHPFNSSRRRVTGHLQSVQVWQRSVLSLRGILDLLLFVEHATAVNCILPMVLCVAVNKDKDKDPAFLIQKICFPFDPAHGV